MFYMYINVSFEVGALEATNNSSGVKPKWFTLRKLTHAIYRDFYSFKNEKFQQKDFDIFLIFAQKLILRVHVRPASPRWF